MERGDGELSPGPRRIVLLDADGREYEPAQIDGLETPLRPGQASEAHLVFELPATAKPVHLRFEDADPLKRVLIRSETAPMHKRTLFRLG